MHSLTCIFNAKVVICKCFPSSYNHERYLFISSPATHGCRALSALNHAPVIRVEQELAVCRRRQTSPSSKDVVKRMLERKVRADIANKKNQHTLHIAAKCLTAWDDDLDGLNQALRAQDGMIRMLRQSGRGTVACRNRTRIVSPAYSPKAGRKKASNIFAVQILVRAKRVYRGRE